MRSRWSSRGDADVGAHYADPARAAGLARQYEADTPLGLFYRDRLERVIRCLEGSHGELLDAGCGTGQMLRALREQGRFSLTGLDRSESVLAVARQATDADPAVRLVAARIEQMPFANAAFDVVVAMGSLEYVTSVEDAVREIARVVRPGGLVVVTMQNAWSPYRLWDRTVWSRWQRRRGRAVSPVVHRVRPAALCRLLESAGLAPASLAHYGFNVFLPPLDLKFPHLAMGVEKRLEVSCSGALRRVGTDYMVVAARAGGDGGSEPA